MIVMHPEIARSAGTLYAASENRRPRVVHRDLKPDNLFLSWTDDDEERVKLLDFGIAKLLETAVASTGGGGTPLFMAPEQTRRGHDIGPWTDIWAFGLVATLLLKNCCRVRIRHGGTFPPPALRRNHPAGISSIARARLREQARARTASDPQRRRWLKVVIASHLRGIFTLELPRGNRRRPSGNGMFFERSVCVKHESCAIVCGGEIVT